MWNEGPIPRIETSFVLMEVRIKSSLRVERDELGKSGSLGEFQEIITAGSQLPGAHLNASIPPRSGLYLPRYGVYVLFRCRMVPPPLPL